MLSAGRAEPWFESRFFEAWNRFLGRFEAAIPAADSLRYNLEVRILDYHSDEISRTAQYSFPPHVPSSERATSMKICFKHIIQRFGTVLIIGLATAGTSMAQAPSGEIQFERIQLSSDFYAEGAAFGDFNGDGKGDVVSGPWIYWGGDFEKKSRIYEGDAIDPIGYSENFLMSMATEKWTFM
jgi:hypothetical protein